ncbi:MAG TPA: hypothetical protein VM140_08440 [Burkholderiales bacterium]|nr:hypothetical protein [Burkholderiales bacterium]
MKVGKIPDKNPAALGPAVREIPTTPFFALSGGMDDKEKPFRYLTQEEFLALPESARAEYLKRVTDHLALRVTLMSKRHKPEPKS